MKLVHYTHTDQFWSRRRNRKGKHTKKMNSSFLNTMLFIFQNCPHRRADEVLVSSLSVLCSGVSLFW